MQKQFEAYYSEKWAWLWLLLSIVFCIGIALESFLWQGTVSLICMIALSVCILVFMFMFVKTKNQTGIAVEIVDNILILHKKETISIPLIDIQRIDVHDGDGSFDIVVKTETKKYSMHCFIKEQRKKKETFIAYLKSKNVKVATFDLR